jgi:hypothetical protein
MVSDMSAIDTHKYDNFIVDNSKSNKFLYYNIYYFYFLKIRLTLFLNLDFKVNSIDFLYKNSN